MLKKIINNILHFKVKDLKPNGNVFNTLKTGSVLLILSIILIVLIGCSFNWSFKCENSDIINLIIKCCIAGIIEEILFRAIILKSIYNATSKNKKDIIISICVSSIIFALAHIVNITTTENIIDIIVQIFSSLIGGIYLGSVFIKNDDWVGCAIIHIIYNFSIGIIGLFTGDMTEIAYNLEQSSVLNNIIVFLQNSEDIILLISSIYIIKKIKTPQKGKEIANET